MTDADDSFAVLDDSTEEEGQLQEPWRIMLVDDEPDVHASTLFSLGGVLVHGRPLDFRSFYTGRSAVDFLSDPAGHPHTHLMVLDAVMETPTAGLECARFIKEFLRLPVPIIVMRSGFAPGEVEENFEKHGYLAEFVSKTNATRENMVRILNKYLTQW